MPVQTPSGCWLPGRGAFGKIDDLQQRFDGLTVKLNAMVERMNSGQGTAGQLQVNPQLNQALEGTMRELGASGVDAKVLNISERGFMAVAEGRFEVGSRVWLMLPGRERANAVVKWTVGDKIGAEFAQPVSVEDIDA